MARQVRIRYNSVMKKYCHFNGKITTLDKVKISPYDIGMLRGYGVFDVMCTQNGKAFLLDEHWKRFQNSAKELGLKIPIAKEEYEKIVEKLLRMNNFKKANIRTVLTGGTSANAFAYKPGRETFFILIEKFNALPNEVFEKGAKVITLEYDRDFPRAKVTNYVAAIRKQEEKIRKKALEIIYIRNGKALEASTSNFFIVKNQKLITTKDGILVGITRNLAIELARQNGLKVEERAISEKELFSADEVFLTATNKDIVPIVNVAQRKIGDGKPGKITRQVMEAFQKFAKNY